MTPLVLTALVDVAAVGALLGVGMTPAGAELKNLTPPADNGEGQPTGGARGTEHEQGQRSA